MIEFPHLGLKFAISRVAFSVFGIDIFWYGIIIAFGFMLAVLLAMKESKKFGIESENIIDLVLFAVPVAIIFARLYYVVFSWQEFKDNLVNIFNTRLGGLAIYGAIIGAVLVAYIFAKWKNINIWKLFDLAAPYIVMAQGIGRWGNFVNQEAFGSNTNLPWGMTGDNISRQLSAMQMEGKNVTPDLPVHPTFLYESLWDIGAFLILLWFRKRKKIDGEVFFLYMILYGAGRFWIEGLRTDSLMLGSVRISQLLAFVFVAVFISLFFIRRSKAASSDEDNVELGTSGYGSVLKKLHEEDAKTEEETNVNDTVISGNEEENSTGSSTPDEFTSVETDKKE